MKAKELTVKILLANGFKKSENEVYECFLQTDHRLYMYYNYLERRWSVWYLSGEGKQHLGYCKTVEWLNILLQKNNIDKQIRTMSKAEEFIQDNTKRCSDGVRPFEEWLTPDQARRAVEIAREEMIDKLRKWVSSKNERDSFTLGYIGRHFDELLKEAMKDET